MVCSGPGFWRTMVPSRCSEGVASDMRRRRWYIVSPVTAESFLQSNNKVEAVYNLLTDSFVYVQ